jgi:probable HAF family extracellular repeat protein
MKCLLGGLAALALLLFPLRSPAGYLVTDLGSLGADGNLGGINSSGQVVGYARSGPVIHAFLYSYSTGVKTDLGTLAGNFSFATAVNDAGQVVGYSTATPSMDYHAFLYSGGKMTDLGTLGGGRSEALGISPTGQVVGWGDLPTGVVTHAFLSSGGKMQDLSGHAVPVLSNATGINASGQIVGALGSPGTSGYLLSGGGVTSLPFAAAGINAAGQVVGTSYGYAGFPRHAFLYSPAGGVQDLGSLAGGTGVSYGVALNDKGQVVGSSTTATGAYHAFLYQGGTMTDLNSLLPAGSKISLYWATGINDRGQIAAVGSGNHGYLLTPDGVSATPEPSGLILLTLGSAGLLARTWRRQRAATATD